MSLTTLRRKFKRADKIFYWGFIIIFGASAFSLFGTYQINQRAQAEDAVVARVNGDEISRDLYQNMLQLDRQRLQMSNPSAANAPEMEIQMRAAAYDMAEKATLQVQMAKQMGVHVSDAEARAQQQKYVDQFLTGKLAGLTGEDKRAAEDQARRMFPLELVQNDMLRQGLQKQLESQTKPTEADLMKSFQEYKTRHILIKTDGRPEAEAKRRADEALAKVKAGGNFEQLARQYSDDPGSKAKGGDLGWVNQKTGFVPEFKEALFKLGKGEVSPLVKSQFGYHIIKVEDIRSNVPKDINKPGKKADYLKQYTDQLVQEKFGALMDKAQKSAKVEPVDPFVKGYLAENAMLEAMQKNNQPLANAKLKEAIAGYEKAAVGRDGGPAIYTKLSQLYQQSKDDAKAIGALKQALAARTEPMMAFQLGELEMKNKNNTGALAAYQKASEVAFDAPWLRPQLASRFKELKRPDLAAKEQTKWEQWQKSSKSGQQIKLPGGQTIQLQHEQTTVSPKEAAKLKKTKTATIPVTTEKSAPK